MENFSSTTSIYRVVGFRISELLFRILGFRFQDSEFRFSIWSFIFRILSRCTGYYKTAFVIWFLFFGICLNGCSSAPSKPYDRSLVVTYAELTLLYEKEKMNNKVVDSLYQVKVKDFFAEKGLKQDDFKKEIEELSQENEVWKMFIQEVTTAMDSLKSIK